MGLTDLIDFFVEIDSLKRTQRYSQCDNAVRESTASHSWKASLMAFVIADELKLDINKEHAVKLLLVHDLVEYLDKNDIDSVLVARGNVTEKDKRNNEEKVIRELCSRYSFGQDIYELWREYDENSTIESRYAKAIDKLEAQTHLINIGGEHFDDTEHCARYADKAVENFPELRELAQEIKTRIKKEGQRL